MNDPVTDIDRPDVGGVLPKMHALANRVRTALQDILPFVVVTTSDNVCSCVDICLSWEPKEQLANGIYYNSTYASISIQPPGRWYNEGDKLVVESGTHSNKLKRFRKGTVADIDKAIEKIKKWIASN